MPIEEAPSAERVRITATVIPELYVVIQRASESFNMSEASLIRAALCDYFDIPNIEAQANSGPRRVATSLTPEQRAQAKKDRKTQREKEKRDTMNQLRLRAGLPPVAH